MEVKTLCIFFYKENCIQGAAYLQVAVNIFQFCPNNVNYAQEEFSEVNTQLGVGVESSDCALP